MVSHITLHVFLIGPLPIAPSPFEIGSSSVTVLDPVSKVAAFFARFDQPEVNGPPYVDFHGFRIPEDCASHLVAVYSSCGDFMQGFCLGRSTESTF